MMVVIVWTEKSLNNNNRNANTNKHNWEKTIITQRDCSINAIAWAPYSYNLPTLAAAGADGYINIFTLMNNNQWQQTARFFAHPMDVIHYHGHLII